jgi:hypothetical protein
MNPVAPLSAIRQEVVPGNRFSFRIAVDSTPEEPRDVSGSIGAFFLGIERFLAGVSEACFGRTGFRRTELE